MNTTHHSQAESAHFELRFQSLLDDGSGYPKLLSYPVAKAVNPRLGLGAQANIRSTM